MGLDLRIDGAGYSSVRDRRVPARPKNPMNEDLVEKIAKFVERQCDRTAVYHGSELVKCTCTIHWTATQIRMRKFEIVANKEVEEEKKQAEEEFLRRHGG